jgi:hypothetical protein
VNFFCVLFFINCLDKVLDRQERIELLVDKTEELNQSSIDFKKKSTALKRAMWWKFVIPFFEG